MRHQRGALRAEIMRYVVLVAFLGGMFYPIVFMLLTTGKTNAELSINFFGLPRDFQVENYTRAFNAVLPYIGNSIKVSGVTVIGQVALSVLGGYAFARFKFPGKNILFYAVVSLMMVPGILTFVPQFIIARDLSLLGNHNALIFPYIAGSQVGGIFMMRIFFASLPEELMEAARVDGANELTILSRIAVPLSIPMIMVIAVQNILGTWNDYIWPLVTISMNESARTIPIGLAFLPTEYAQIPYGAVMAGYTLSAIPMAILFVFTMRYFVQGLSSGALKL
ncbi:MAG: carbohydrate ABC transporter permease [Anaerolineae bacterium]|nr:carbohydrate ABC transporter permease [Anaerolineae bacterium]